jgi:hypothetical protein
MEGGVGLWIQSKFCKGVAAMGAQLSDVALLGAPRQLFLQ